MVVACVKVVVVRLLVAVVLDVLVVVRLWLDIKFTFSVDSQDDAEASCSITVSSY